ncbi:MAG: carbohydrate ABC transporter permease, partial [Lachnospirales bacterium]
MICLEKRKESQLITLEERIFSLLASIIGILITIICLYPIFYVLIVSVSKPFYVENGDVMFWVKGFTLESYKQAFAKDGLWLAYLNTFFYTIFGVIANMFFTTTMAYALSKEKLVFRKFFTFLVVFTMWFNAGMIPLYMTFVDLNLLNTRTSIIIGFAINTYNLIILKSFFEQVPPSLEEAAVIDGASNFQIFRKVFLPLSKPALATVGMFYCVNRWNGYFWAMNLLKDDSKIPLQVLLKKLIVDQVANETEAGIVTMDSLASQTTIIYAIIIIAIIPMTIAYPFV